VAYWQQYQHQHNSQQALVAERVAQVAVWLGQKLYFGQEQLNQLAIAGQLYAIGQLSLPTGLRDHLRQQQLGLMKDHSHLIQHYHDVLVSAALIERLENATEASHWVLAHGERFDGQGGPFGLKGALIPMGARVLAIAIAFVTAYDKTLYLTGHASLKHTLQTLEQQANTVLDPYGVGLLEQYTEADWLSV
jgi:response regulator RpfG family c-di-GMP phosphodiesterase